MNVGKQVIQLPAVARTESNAHPGAAEDAVDCPLEIPLEIECHVISLPAQVSGKGKDFCRQIAPSIWPEQHRFPSPSGIEMDSVHAWVTGDEIAGPVFHKKADNGVRKPIPQRSQSGKRVDDVSDRAQADEQDPFKPLPIQTVHDSRLSQKSYQGRPLQSKAASPYTLHRMMPAAIKACRTDFREAVHAWLEGRLPVQTVKENPARTVQRGSGLYFKRFKEGGLWARIRRRLSNRALREFRILGRLAQAGVGAPRPVAWGVDRDSSFVVTQEIADVRILKAELAGRYFPVRERRALLTGLASFARRIHDAGIRHDDFHIGNVLVGEGPSFYVLDVHRARAGRVGEEGRIQSLAFLLHSLSTFTTRAECVRFLRDYLGEHPDRRFLERISRQFGRVRARYWSSREERCVLNSGEFAVEGGWFLRRPMTAAEAGAVLAAPARTVKQLERRSLRITGELFIKSDPRAEAIWRNSRALEVRHLPTPKLRACRRGDVIGDWLKDSKPLWDFVKERFPVFSREERGEFVFHLARLVRRMHELGVYHHDLKANNILIDPQGSFSIVDLDRVSFGRVPGRRRRHNLAQLNAAVGTPVSRTDRLRFYRWYAPYDRDVKQNVGEIMRLTRRRKHIWP